MLVQDPAFHLLQYGAQTYLMLDAQAQLARERAAAMGRDPERAYRRAMWGGLGKTVGLAMLPYLMFSRSSMGLAAAWTFNWAIHGGVSRALQHWRHMTSVYRSAVVPMMHSFEHTERSFQAMQQGLSAIHGYRTMIGQEAAVMAARYAR